ncbi:MAG: S46 family peptidase, partial [Burkholderiales bacterium]|nr:S46 family peptidase [Burkholderiales bacterium]
MQKKLLALLLTLPGLALADEGMWTLDNLPQARMQADYGFKPDADWVKRAMLSSARMVGGCSASFISKDGLIMTNHHCVEDCLEQISSEKKNYLKDGFHARARKEEQVCPAMEMNRLEQIKDVTAQVTAATAGLSGTAYKQAQNAIRATLTSAC